MTIPSSVTSIGNSAFQRCTGLTSVIIPNSVTTIGHNTFRDCSGLTSVIIPSSVTSIGYYAFYDCSGLSEIYCAAINPPECEGEVFDGIDKSECMLYVPEESVELYETADEWKDFFNISGYEFNNGIDAVNSDSYPAFEGVYRVYNLSGVCVMVTADKNEIQSLPAGLYIVNGVKTIIR